MRRWKALGLMSGTSLDGLDMAYVEFYEEDGWKFTTGPCETLPYSTEWLARLQQATDLTGFDLTQLDRTYGNYLGEAAKTFLRKHSLQVDCISSHGHTVFHQPAAGVTLQIGHGAHIAAVSGETVVCDFRSMDVALHGNGAPLVPLGDRHLFGSWPVCLNLGGFANISGERIQQRVSWDIGPFNTVLNRLAQQKNQPYDKDGILAKSGQIQPVLLEKWQKIPYFSQKPPKSLGIEWVQDTFLPTLENTGFSPEDISASFCRFMAECITRDAEKLEGNEMLVTGGGAYHKHFMEQLRSISGKKIHIPEPGLVEFKEAVIFAWLGMLRLENRVNIVSSATGAERNQCSGAVYIGHMH